MHDPLLAAIVCTHDRPRDLERCLEAFAALEDPVQLLIVDSASTIPVSAVVEQFTGRIPGLRHVRVEEPGLSLARNVGIAQTSASLVAFVDDDAAPEPDWARAQIAAFTNPEVGCVGGQCAPDFEAARPRWLSDRLLQLAGITRFGAYARQPRSSAEWPFGANIAFRRAALEQVGGFETSLGRNGSSLLSGEDSDMVQRILAAGWRVWLVPSARVRHRVSRERCTSRYYWRRLWWTGVTRAGDSRAGLRLLLAVPIRIGLYATTLDRIYLYRLAETAGYFVTRAERLIASRSEAV